MLPGKLYVFAHNEIGENDVNMIQEKKAFATAITNLVFVFLYLNRVICEYFP